MATSSEHSVNINSTRSGTRPSRCFKTNDGCIVADGGGAQGGLTVRPLQEVGGHEALAVADSALVDHSPVVRHLDRLADAGLAALHYTQLVPCVVYTQGGHLFTGEPLPAKPHTHADCV